MKGSPAVIPAKGGGKATAKKTGPSSVDNDCMPPREPIGKERTAANVKAGNAKLDRKLRTRSSTEDQDTVDAPEIINELRWQLVEEKGE